MKERRMIDELIKKKRKLHHKKLMTMIKYIIHKITGPLSVLGFVKWHSLTMKLYLIQN